MDWFFKDMTHCLTKTTEIDSTAKSKANSITVLVTGATGQLAYSLVPLICSGNVFGSDAKVTLHLYDNVFLKRSLDGFAMEIIDCAYPNLSAVLPTTEMETAFKNVDVAFILAGAPKREGMSRIDFVAANGKILSPIAKALVDHAKKTVKVLVVCPPALTNAYIIRKATKDKIPDANITALTRLDQNRARVAFASLNKVLVSEVDRVLVWGNRSANAYPDVSNATIRFMKGEFNKLDPKFIADFQKLEENFLASSSGKRFFSPMATAKAAADHMQDWWRGTKEWVSVGILADNHPYRDAFELSDGLFFGFPCTCSPDTKNWEYVPDLDLKEARKYLENSAKELLDEKLDAENTAAMTK